MTACRFGTIAARNYIPSVRLLARSLSAVHSDARLQVLLCDADESDLATYRLSMPEADWYCSEDLGLDPELLAGMRAWYEVTEHATALKAAWLTLLLDELARDGARNETAPSEAVAVYLDPDIEVFASLEPLVAATRAGTIALTPHVLEPVPRDGLDTREEAFLVSGQFNLGFIAVSQGARNFLQWWHARLTTHARIDAGGGYFTDQRWVDCVPSLFEHRVVRDSGCNVAYWNLHERTLALSEGRDGDQSGPGGHLRHLGPHDILVDGGPLRFFHFSGHDATRPYVLSKHAPATRVDVAADPILRRMLAERSERITTLSSTWSVPYRWARTPSGGRLSAAVRHAYRDAVDEADARDIARPPSPFSPRGEGPWRDWLAQPPLEALGSMCRLGLIIWSQRPDLQAAFPDPHDGHAAAFAQWLLRDLEFSTMAGPSLIADTKALAAGRGRRLGGPVPQGGAGLARGVNVAGYLRGEFGLGTYHRMLADAVVEADLELAVVNIDAAHHSQRVPLSAKATCIDAVPFDLTLVAVNADVLDGLRHSARWAALSAGRATVGVWAWELPLMPPAMAAAAQCLDEIWCGSVFIKSALEASGVTCPVHVHPMVVTAPQATSLTAAGLGLCQERFWFANVFDFSSVAARKNPLGLVAAYRAAFTEDDGAGLVIKTINRRQSPQEAGELADAIAGRQDIVWIDGAWDAGRMDALYQLADAYVSLHRSEGIGLTMLSAMAAGRPVIATNWSGNVDFMDAHSALLVPSTLCAVGEGAGPYPADGQWAEPDLAVAATMMRQLLADRPEAELLGARGRDRVLEQFAPVVAGRWIARRYEVLTGRAARAVGSSLPATPVAEPVPDPVPIGA